MAIRISALALVLAMFGCTDDGPGPAGPPDGGPMVDAGRDAGMRNGCPILADPVAMPGDPIDGDTYDTFASGFFTTYCVRCHSTTLTTPMERNGAPMDRNWDDEASVRMYLPQIRLWVGELNAMPFDDPEPSCDERLRMVRWLDADAP